MVTIPTVDGIVLCGPESVLERLKRQSASEEASVVAGKVYGLGVGGKWVKTRKEQSQRREH